MDSMKCFSCVLKHLSTALSFGKEIMSGHSKGDELDHRIDFLGEISNAEQHLELIDKNLFNEISTYRKEIQGKDVLIEAKDLDFIRQIYLKIENLKDGIKNVTGFFEPLNENPDIVYLNVSNKDFFDLSIKTLKLHLKNYSNIYVLKSSVDLSEYKDINVLNEELKDFMKRTDITPDVLILNENMGILKDYDARRVFQSFSRKMPHDIFPDIKPIADKKILFYDDLKIQPINVKIFNEIMENKNYKYFLSAYFYWSNLQIGADDNQVSVNVDRPVCCSIRTNLKIRTFMRWNDISFESLKKELGI